ncbi:hypothetical protein [Flavobacterium sp.]|jgi:hypothetical protein|uniref:hypothetical protein n=1 Tax=Flavobacterium sp. TaxID=239 RepID=UPI0037C07549
MHLKHHLLFWLCGLLSINAISQTTINVEKLDSISWDIDRYLGFDQQLNQYAIKDNVVLKRTKNEVLVYKNLSLGKIERVDFQNPLQLVVFYKEFNTLVLLDNQLNETKRIDFNLSPTFIQLEAMGLSAQNQLWVYDGNSNRLGLYTTTKDHTKWITVPQSNPLVNYNSDYTYFYWVDNQKRVSASSIYGKLTTLGSVPKHDNIQLVDATTALYCMKQQLYLYEIAKGISRKIEITENFVDNFFFKDGILAIFTQNKITNYKLILP